MERLAGAALELAVLWLIELALAFQRKKMKAIGTKAPYPGTGAGDFG
jgi:hypothetical protein